MGDLGPSRVDFITPIIGKLDETQQKAFYITSSTMILAVSNFADEDDGRFQDAAASRSPVSRGHQN